MPTVQKATMPTLVCGMARVELSGLEKVRSLLRADGCSEARQQAKARDGQEEDMSWTCVTQETVGTLGAWQLTDIVRFAKRWI